MVQICFEPVIMERSKRVPSMAVSSTNKKVVIIRYDREALAGVVNPGSFGDSGPVEILTGAGNLVRAAYDEIKAICFVKDLPAPDAWQPHRLFSVRPKSGGLWLRLRFRDQDTLDGVVPNNLLTLDPGGFSIVPPDPSFFNQRIFVPRGALVEAQVMGVIGSPLRRASKKAPAKSPAQIEMFGDDAARNPV